MSYIGRLLQDCQGLHVLYFIAQKLAGGSHVSLMLLLLLLLLLFIRKPNKSHPQQAAHALVGANTQLCSFTQQLMAHTHRDTTPGAP